MKVTREGEGPVKMQRISSICVRHGAADKIGEVKAKEYEEDLKVMVEEYRARNAVEKAFQQHRLKRPESANRGIQVL